MDRYLIILSYIFGIVVVTQVDKNNNPVFTTVDEEEDRKHPAFRRLDTAEFSKWKLFAGAMTLLLPRIIILLSYSCVVFVFLRVVYIVKGLDTKKYPPKSIWALRKIFVYFQSILMRACFGYSMTWQKVDFDYSFYLGTNWREELAARTKIIPSIVVNHGCMTDFSFYMG